eukprot:gene15258-6466_t
MIVASLAFILLTATFCVASEEEEMEVGIELVGCFADDANDRALPTLFENVRDKIIWSNMNETVRMCADAAANHDPLVLNDSTDFMQPTCGLVFNSTENAGLELTQR